MHWHGGEIGLLLSPRLLVLLGCGGGDGRRDCRGGKVRLEVEWRDVLLLGSSLGAGLVLANQDRWIERLAFSLGFLARASHCRHFSVLAERVCSRHLAQMHRGVFLRLGSLSQLSQSRLFDLSACSKMALVAMLIGSSGRTWHLQE